MTVVILAGGAWVMYRRRNAIAAKAHDRNPREADPLAHYENLYRPRTQRFHRVLRLQGLRFLNWQARWNITQALERAVEWYKAWHAGRDVQPVMIRQLADFVVATRK